MEHLDTVLHVLGGPNGIWFLAAGFFGMVGLERLYYALRRPGRYDNLDAACNLAINLMNSAMRMGLALLIPFTFYVVMYERFRFFTITSLPLACAVAFMVADLAYYWEHRLSHRIGLLWAFHTIHHASNEFNHTVAARGFLLDGLGKIPLSLPAALLGVPPVVYVGIEVVKNLYGVWNHADYVGKLGWIDRVFVTPSNHRVHHGNQPEYIDRNYGQVLLLWDRIFGSWEPEGRAPVYGLVHRVHDQNPITAQFVGIRELWNRMQTADRLSDKLRYLWKPPEWSHDGVCRSACPRYAKMVGDAA